MGDTTITISNDLWKIINNERINPKETMEDVIWRWYNLSEETLTSKKNENNMQEM